LETGKKFSNGDIPELDMKGKPSCSQQPVADAFNNYCLSIADTFTKNNTHNKLGTKKILLPLLSLFYLRFLKIPLC
jgi:hypothetical protein